MYITVSVVGVSQICWGDSVAVAETSQRTVSPRTVPNVFPEANLVRNLKLAKSLLQENSDGVLHGARVETAWRQILTDRPHLLASDQSAVGIAHKATNNLMADESFANIRRR
eukprot:9266196-Pyramimonas_sp.AAC.1